MNIISFYLLNSRTHIYSSIHVHSRWPRSIFTIAYLASMNDVSWMKPNSLLQLWYWAWAPKWNIDIFLWLDYTQNVIRLSASLLCFGIDILMMRIMSISRHECHTHSNVFIMYLCVNKHIVSLRKHTIEMKLATAMDKWTK